MSIAVISGGTATNELVPLFSSISNKITYILPISDNGGSTSEIIRIIGGPAIGDIRSRLTRLIPSNQEPLRKLLSFRLSLVPTLAKIEWNEIVDGSHELWDSINPSTKEIFRSFFIHVHTELLKRSKMHNTNKQFRYELANVGNLFLTGVRLFIGSLDSAIELFIRLTGISSDIHVLPCINTNFPYHISALLENGLIITGQSQISHPLNNKSYPPVINKTRPPSPTILPSNESGEVLDFHLDLKLNVQQKKIPPRASSFHSVVSSDDEESGNTPQYIHPDLKISQLHISKSDNIEPLLSPIERIFYISPHGEEICPVAHNRVTTTLYKADCIVFSIGSLMTSVVPVIILKGVGKAILNNPIKKKILLLNGCHDRETNGMCAVDFVDVLVKLAFYSLGHSTNAEGGAASVVGDVPWTNVVSHIVYLEDSQILVDQECLKSKGINCVEVKRLGDLNYYDPDDLEKKLKAVITED